MRKSKARAKPKPCKTSVKPARVLKIEDFPVVEVAGPLTDDWIDPDDDCRDSEEDES